MPNFGSERNREAWERLRPEQQAAVERIQTRHQTPEYRAEEQLVREEVRQESPPLVADEALLVLLSALRGERKRQGLSLTNLQERTGMDRSTISKLELGKVGNPTYATLRALARALGMQLVIGLTEPVAETVERRR